MTKSNYFSWSKLLILMVLGTIASACAPAKIPRDASHEWGFINGSVWYWSDKLDSGCTSWMASERWVSVQLVTNSGCSTEVRHDRIKGKRVSYADYSDELLFRDYGPWSWDIRDGLGIFDNEGNFLGFKPCPHEITKQDIFEMTLLAKEGAEVATTDDEKKMMERIASRFDKVDLSALSSGQFGCTDAPLRRPAQNLLEYQGE